ncbi:hypothetical protein GQ44DRAFT_804442 [Phaeosphaeriaceae sp. PMI808]|nr:hypothetical protein GQ44DRAFT_804442 [Phaeosphaeriaceae sp. PMI808]
MAAFAEMAGLADVDSSLGIDRVVEFQNADGTRERRHGVSIARIFHANMEAGMVGTAGIVSGARLASTAGLSILRRVHLPQSHTQKMSIITGSQIVNSGESLLSLLRVSRLRDASVAKDRIFGLLGIADEANVEKYAEDALRLPYSLDMHQTFLRTTLHLLKHHKSLEVLKMVEYLPGYVCLELSWVPRWDKKEFARAAILSEAKDETGFCADGGIPLKLEQPDRDTLLSVHGQRLDRVIATSKILSRYELYYGDRVESMEIFDIWADFQKTMLPMTGQSGFEWYWRWHAGFRDLKMNLLQEEIKGGSRASFLGAFHRSAEHRRIFLTANGYIGLGPAAMEVEDQVCVLFGSNVPYVYRNPANKELLAQGYLGPFTANVALNMIGVKDNRDERFDPNDEFYLPPYSDNKPWDGGFLKSDFPKVLVGHCYVHGMMHGEAVRKNQAENMHAVVFNFC